MTNEATKPIKPGSEQDDPEYPYLLFVQDRGWKYADEGQRQAAYLREILVRHNKILNEDEFAAEAGEKYADAAKVIYPKLAVWARSGIITPESYSIMPGIFGVCRILKHWSMCRLEPNAGQ